MTKKYCKDCNIIITGHGKPIRCMSCAQKKCRVGMKFSKSHKKQLSLARQGNKHWNYIDGRTNNKYFCKDCGK